MADGDMPLHQQFCEMADEHLRLMQRWQKMREALDGSNRSYDKGEYGRVTQRLRETQAALQEFTWRFENALLPRKS